MTDPSTHRPVPRRVVLAAVAGAGVASWVVAAIVAVNAWRTGFGGGVRTEAGAGAYLVLALLASAFVALPFTFLQWVNPDCRDRWRSIGGAVGVAGCLVFLALWLLH